MNGFYTQEEMPPEYKEPETQEAKVIDVGVEHEQIKAAWEDGEAWVYEWPRDHEKAADIMSYVQSAAMMLTQDTREGVWIALAIVEQPKLANFLVDKPWSVKEQEKQDEQEAIGK